jgi:hypothetical protein
VVALILGTLLIPIVVGIGYALAASAAGTYAFGKIGFLLGCLFGAILGGFYYGISTIGKVRNPSLLAVFAIVGVLITWFVKTEFEAIAYYGAAPAAVVAGLPGRPFARFSGYIDSMSNGGLVQTEDGDTSDGVAITGPAFWFEFLMPPFGLFVAPLLGLAAGRRPFCENCNLWTNSHKLSLYPVQASPKLKELVSAGDWDGLRALPKAAKPDTRNYSAVWIDRCKGCGDSAVRVIYAIKSKVKPLFYGTIDPDVASSLFPVKK